MHNCRLNIFSDNWLITPLLTIPFNLKNSEKSFSIYYNTKDHLYSGIRFNFNKDKSLCKEIAQMKIEDESIYDANVALKDYELNVN